MGGILASSLGIIDPGLILTTYAYLAVHCANTLQVIRLVGPNISFPRPLLALGGETMKETSDVSLGQYAMANGDLLTRRQ